VKIQSATYISVPSEDGENRLNGFGLEERKLTEQEIDHRVFCARRQS
jgi:hypothetical protein